MLVALLRPVTMQSSLTVCLQFSDELQLLTKKPIKPRPWQPALSLRSAADDRFIAPTQQRNLDVTNEQTNMQVATKLLIG